MNRKRSGGRRWSTEEAVCSPRSVDFDGEVRADPRGCSAWPSSASREGTTSPKRSTAEILSGGVRSKLAALSPEKLPEVMPEPVEEFPTAAPHLKIAAGSEPWHLEVFWTHRMREDLAVTAKPMINLSEKVGRRIRRGRGRTGRRRGIATGRLASGRTGRGSGRWPLRPICRRLPIGETRRSMEIPRRKLFHRATGLLRLSNQNR